MTSSVFDHSRAGIERRPQVNSASAGEVHIERTESAGAEEPRYARAIGNLAFLRPGWVVGGTPPSRAAASALYVALTKLPVTLSNGYAISPAPTGAIVIERDVPGGDVVGAELSSDGLTMHLYRDASDPSQDQERTVPLDPDALADHLASAS